MALYPIPVEDVDFRSPEWEDIQPGYGQNPIRSFQWDPIHNQIKSEGPTVQIKEPERPL
jgi:hypothetical protein